MHNRTNQGFTLIELLVTITIVGILVSVALPSYLTQVRASHRTDAQMTIQRVAMSLERFYTTYGKIMDTNGETYDLDQNFGNTCIPRISECASTSDEIRYFISLENLTPTGYTIVATPKNDQLDDKCGVLTLDHTNTKTVSGAEVTPADCW